MTRVPIPAPEWLGAPGRASSAMLHEVGDLQALHRALVQRLEVLLPGADWVVLVYDGQAGAEVVARSAGLGAGPGASRCPFGDGSITDLDAWQGRGARRVPLQFRNAAFGEFQICVGDATDLTAPGTSGPLGELLTHYAVALANLTLGDAAREDANRYCAAMVALEEGIALFHEDSREAAGARFLELVMATMGAPAGALFLRRSAETEEGDPGNLPEFELAQAMAMPEHMAVELLGDRATAQQWLGARLTQSASLHLQEPDGGLGGLDPLRVPPALQSLVVVPVRQMGDGVGVAMLFNAAMPVDEIREGLTSLERLGSLCAMVLQQLAQHDARLGKREAEVGRQVEEVLRTRLTPSAMVNACGLQAASHGPAMDGPGCSYLDARQHADGTVDLVLANTEDDGLGAVLGLHTLREQWWSVGGGADPGQLLDQIAAALPGVDDGGGSAPTVTALRFAPGGGHLTWSGAGAVQILCFQQDGGLADASTPLPELTPGGSGSATPRQGASLTPGDVLVVPDPACVELLSPDGEAYGVDRIMAAVEPLLSGSAEEIRDGLVTDLTAHAARTGDTAAHGLGSFWVVKITD